MFFSLSYEVELTQCMHAFFFSSQKSKEQSYTHKTTMWKSGDTTHKAQIYKLGHSTLGSKPRALLQHYRPYLSSGSFRPFKLWHRFKSFFEVVRTTAVSSQSRLLVSPVPFATNVSDRNSTVVRGRSPTNHSSHRSVAHLGLLLSLRQTRRLLPRRQLRFQQQFCSRRLMDVRRPGKPAQQCEGQDELHLLCR